MLLELDLARHEQAEPRVVRLPTAWRVVRRVRSVVDGVLANEADSLRQSARLVASELLENVIKYGEVLPDGSQPMVSVQLSNGVLTIRSRNGVAHPDDPNRIFEILRRMKGRKDVQSVYIEAIVQAMAIRGKSAALGLLRIAAEAAFELDATFEGGVLEIIAKKGTT